MKSLKLIPAVILVFAFITPLFSKPVIIDKSLKRLPIGSFVEYLEDETGRLSLGDVQNPKNSGKWVLSSRESLGFGFTKSVIWVHFKIKNISRDDLDFYLEEGFAHIDSIKLFIPEKGSYREISAGDHKPFSHRPVLNRNFVFPLNIKPDTEASYYLRFQTESGMNINLRIWSPDAFRSSSFREYLILISFYSIIFIMAVYNLFIFFFIGRREYLFYSLFIFFYVLFIMSINGTAFQYIWPDNPWWANFCIPVLLCLLLIFAILFFIYFGDFRRLGGKLYRASLGLLYAVHFLLILCLFLPYRISMISSVVLAGIIILIGSFGVIYYAIKKHRPAFFLFTGFGALLTGSFLYILKTFGVLPTNFFTEWSIQIGSVLMVIILSIALGDRINGMRVKLNSMTVNLKEQSRLIEAMLKFSNKINSLKDVDEIYDFIIETVEKYTDCERVSIMLVDENNSHLVIKRSSGIPDEVRKNITIKVGEGIAGKVYQDGVMVVINDMSKMGFEKKYSTYDSFISSPVIIAPMVGPNLKIGVINATNKRGNAPFTDDDSYIMSYISQTAAIALNNQLNEVRLEDSFLGTIKSLAEAVDAKDPYTRGHSDRVSKLAVSIAIEMELSREEMRMLKFAGILHDIGKIGISEIVLGKPGKLNKEEFEIIKRHPEIGENILKNINFLHEAIEAIRHHHERMDGSGYPDGLKGESISLGARILAVADTFDAMNSDRPYRGRIDIKAIIKELNEIKGEKLDRDCVDCLLKYLDGVKGVSR